MYLPAESMYLPGKMCIGSIHDVAGTTDRAEYRPELMSTVERVEFSITTTASHFFVSTKL